MSSGRAVIHARGLMGGLMDGQGDRRTRIQSGSGTDKGSDGQMVGETEGRKAQTVPTVMMK